MDIKTELVKTLRERTGAGVMDCKQALAEAKGEIEAAIECLRKKGLATAARKADRKALEGLVGSYIHIGGKIGVLVEINCETDFVARTDDFKELVKEIAMQIAANKETISIKRDELPAELVEKEKSIYMAQAATLGKPEKIAEKIAEGQLVKFYSRVCLLEEPFIKDPSITVKEYLTQKIAKLGENIVIKRFVRYQLGEVG